jgi:hypothetical protein
MQLNSVSELEDIFLGKCKPNFDFIDKFCKCFGVYKEWLINGEITPYYNSDRRNLMPLDYFDEIKSSNPERIFFVTCNSPARDTFIVLKLNDCKYKILHFTWAISDHVGGTGQAQIFDMYCLIKSLENEGMSTKCTGRMLEEQSFRQLCSGHVFPWGLLESPNCYANYYLDDFTDIYHEHPIAVNYEGNYGQGFLYAQSVVRYDLEAREKQKAAHPLLHIPKHCTTCRALSSKEVDCIF